MFSEEDSFSGSLFDSLCSLLSNEFSFQEMETLMAVTFLLDTFLVPVQDSSFRFNGAKPSNSYFQTYLIDNFKLFHTLHNKKTRNFYYFSASIFALFQCRPGAENVVMPQDECCLEVSSVKQVCPLFSNSTLLRFFVRVSINDSWSSS